MGAPEREYRRVPSTVICGPRGYVVTRGYTVINGLRIYDEQAVVDKYGQLRLSPDRVELDPSQQLPDIE